jgi:hypothetical protein
MVSMVKEKMYYWASNLYLFTGGPPNPDQMGNRMYSKAIQFGKWAAILALTFIAFLYFVNKKDQAGEHLKSVVKGVFILVLAPTIVGILFWIAAGLKV